MVASFAGTQECVGAVSLAAPTIRMGPAELENCAPALIETVKRLGMIWPMKVHTAVSLAAAIRPAIRR
jgi:hypothetical protein